MTQATTTTPHPSDLLSVRSRVNWAAIAAGAMLALTIYTVFTLLGLALGVELALRDPGRHFGSGAAIYSIITLLLAVFFGGWATSRLAVGESKLEAVLYGLILWGVLFAGLIWLLGAGVRTGFGAMLGVASGAYSNKAGRIDTDRVARDLQRAGIDDATVAKYRGYYDRLRDDPGAASIVGREPPADPEVRHAAAQVAEGTRQAIWWTLAGVLASIATSIAGSLTGSDELLQLVPILGVKRPGPVTRP